MPNITIDKIENRIRKDDSLSKENRTELLRLLSKLKLEIEEFSKDNEENAESIAGFIDRSTHEALRKQKDPTLAKIAVDGLTASVRGFESSHPTLVENVNFIANVLSNMGI